MLFGNSFENCLFRGRTNRTYGNNVELKLISLTSARVFSTNKYYNKGIGNWNLNSIAN